MTDKTNQDSTAPITSALLRELERGARASARAKAEEQLREIRAGKVRWLDADGGYRIRLEVTLCPWGDEDGPVYQWGLDVQGTSDFKPTVGCLRDLSRDPGVEYITLCVGYDILNANGDRALDSAYAWRINNHPAWKKGQQIGSHPIPTTKED